MRINSALTDDAILGELGDRLAARRLALQLTQAQAATQAGIAKRTLERMEAGHSSQLSSLIRVLRVLDAMPGLEGLVPSTEPGPIDLLRRKGKTRQRASGSRLAETPSAPWRWEDE